MSKQQQKRKTETSLVGQLAKIRNKKEQTKNELKNGMLHIKLWPCWFYFYLMWENFCEREGSHGVLQGWRSPNLNKTPLISFSATTGFWNYYVSPAIPSDPLSTTHCEFTVRSHNGWGPTFKTSVVSKEPSAWNLTHIG